MWRPKDVDQFEAAVKRGVLEERHDFDAKRELPANSKELAKDIAAMSTDGGALVYGVGEDANGQPRLLTPIALKGAAERIDQVAQHSVSGSLQIRFETLRCADDAGRGYLIAEIPASPLAPHQVVVGNDRRFYGRSDTGNRLLSETEIERLYERRRRLDVDREALLAQCIAASPLGSPTPHQEGFLQAFVQPVIRDDNLWDRAVASQGEERRLLDSIREAATAIRPAGGWAGLSLGPSTTGASAALTSGALIPAL
jgi:schlafen family protein